MYRAYRVTRKKRAPLVDYMVEALRLSGCRILHAPDPGEAPFRITFETPMGERMGVVAYAFFANSEVTRNRPADEHRFQIKYGPDDKTLHEVWQDPFELYTTLFLGINPEQGFFVAADPLRHSLTRFFISLEFKREGGRADPRAGLAYVGTAQARPASRRVPGGGPGGGHPGLVPALCAARTGSQGARPGAPAAAGREALAGQCPQGRCHELRGRGGRARNGAACLGGGDGAERG